ncbi:MAG: ankyrin repeat domain-containing protein [Rickettsiales bacterium]|jgi:hypothetical protein|nr:ankyrin repeat domain-containing protein [Rickettsiales bacterium]
MTLSYGRALVVLFLLSSSEVLPAASRESPEDRKKREEFKSRIFKEEALRNPKAGLSDEDFEPLLDDEGQPPEENADSGKPGVEPEKGGSNSPGEDGKTPGDSPGPEPGDGRGAEGEATASEENDSETRDSGDGAVKGGDGSERSEEIPEKAAEGVDREGGTPTQRRNSMGPRLPPRWSGEGGEPEEKKKKTPKPKKTESKSTRSGRRSGLGDEGLKAAVPSAEEGSEDSDGKKKEIETRKEVKKGKQKIRRNAMSDRDISSLVHREEETFREEEATREKNYDEDLPGEDVLESSAPEPEKTIAPAPERSGRVRREPKEVPEPSGTSFANDLPALRKRKTGSLGAQGGEDRGILEKIYNITDTNVSNDFLLSREYADLLRESGKVKLRKVEMADEKDIPVLHTSAKSIVSFRNSNIPDELLDYRRSETNAHIPLVLNSEDIRAMARRAIAEGSLAALRGLVEKTGNPDFMVDGSRTVLEFAIENGSHSIVRYLIYSGASINRQGPGLNTPLHLAVNSNSLAIVKLLVESGSNLDSQNSFGETPLMLAIIKNYDGIAYELLKNGADVRIRNQDGETAYGLCLRFNRGKIQQYLASIIKTERNMPE